MEIIDQEIAKLRSKITGGKAVIEEVETRNNQAMKIIEKHYKHNQTADDLLKKTLEIKSSDPYYPSK